MDTEAPAQFLASGRLRSVNGLESHDALTDRSLRYHGPPITARRVRHACRIAAQRSWSSIGG